MIKLKTQTQKIIVGVVAAAIVAGGGWWLIARSDTESNPVSTTSTDTTTKPTTSKPTTSKPKPTTTDEDTDSRTPPPSTTVKSKPSVATSAGHNEPGLPNNATVSTTCTTEAKVSCTITFTNQDNPSSVVMFTAKTTNSQGVAEWVWKAGRDVSSGDWYVTASAGGKTSDKELIYIQ